MALSLPANFKKDIQSRDTALFPIVLIGTWPDDWHDDPMVPFIGISVKDSISTGESFLPLLLNLPSLKESIDIENRKYKISSVGIDISNLPYNGKRFSDLVEHKTLINMECRILWVSPSCQGYSIADIFDPADNSAFQIYNGIIRRYDCNDEKVKLIIEDRSQAKLHKDLPISNIGAGESVPDIYKNKPIPMVYGNVDKSPCLFTTKANIDNPENIDLQNIIIDSMPIMSFQDLPIDVPLVGNVQAESSLFIGDSSNGYIPCSRTFKYNITTKILSFAVDEDGDQKSIGLPYIDDNNQNYSYDVENATINLIDGIDNDVSKGFFRGIITRKPHDVKIDSTADNGEPFPEGYQLGFHAIQNYNTEQYAGGGTAYTVHNNPDWDVDGIETNTQDTVRRVINNDINKGVCLRGYCLGGTNGLGGEYMSAKIQLHPVDCNYKSDTYFVGAYFWIGGVEFEEFGLQWVNYMNAAWHLNSPILPTQELETSPQPNWFSNIMLGSPNQADPFGLRVYNTATPSAMLDFNMGAPKFEYGAAGADLQVHIDIWEANVFHVAYIEGLAEKKYYASVVGRLSNPTAPAVIDHILTHELGYTTTSTPTAYTGWKYAFAVDRKINSKKLIEEISESSPYIPHFNSMGEFKYSVIGEYGGALVSEADNGIIKESDVIDYSFSRTQIEQVYSRIGVKYHYDYAKGEFIKDVNLYEDGFGYIDTDDLNGYNLSYYGLNGHDDSTKIFESKYIRDSDTAEKWLWWLLSWHCNQHLKMKVRLTLKYMNLEVGDIIKFDKLLNDVKPYGVDYTTTDLLNGQIVYENFMIISTNKTLEYCEIECIQMHKLAQSESAFYDLGLNESCTQGYDCAGVCGGNAYYDGCGVCGGDGTSCAEENNDCPEGYDCTGVCGGNASIDLCGICGGDNTSCADCAGVPNGDAVVDECGVCGGDCQPDCAGEYGGTAELDSCGTCGGNINYDPDEYNCLECLPEPIMGDLDECGVCGGDNSSCADCADVPNGNSVFDECGNCCDPTNAGTYEQDCGIFDISGPGNCGDGCNNGYREGETYIEDPFGWTCCAEGDPDCVVVHNEFYGQQALQLGKGQGRRICGDTSHPMGVEGETPRAIMDLDQSGHPGPSDGGILAECFTSGHMEECWEQYGELIDINNDGGFNVPDITAWTAYIENPEYDCFCLPIPGYPCDCEGTMFYNDETQCIVSGGGGSGEPEVELDICGNPIQEGSWASEMIQLGLLDPLEEGLPWCGSTQETATSFQWINHENNAEYYNCCDCDGIIDGNTETDNCGNCIDSGYDPADCDSCQELYPDVDEICSGEIGDGGNECWEPNPGCDCSHGYGATVDECGICNGNNYCIVYNYVFQNMKLDIWRDNWPLQENDDADLTQDEYISLPLSDGMVSSYPNLMIHGSAHEFEPSDAIAEPGTRYNINDDNSSSGAIGGLHIKFKYTDLNDTPINSLKISNLVFKVNIGRLKGDFTGEDIDDLWVEMDYGEWAINEGEEGLTEADDGTLIMNLWGSENEITFLVKGIYLRHMKIPNDLGNPEEWEPKYPYPPWSNYYSPSTFGSYRSLFEPHWNGMSAKFTVDFRLTYGDSSEDSAHDQHDDYQGSHNDYFMHDIDEFGPEINFNTLGEANLVLGDMNHDGGWNVLDVVNLANCVIEGAGECGLEGDMNQDGGFNVLDIVALANCVLAPWQNGVSACADYEPVEGGFCDCQIMAFNQDNEGCSSTCDQGLDTTTYSNSFDNGCLPCWEPIADYCGSQSVIDCDNQISNIYVEGETTMISGA